MQKNVYIISSLLLSWSLTATSAQGQSLLNEGAREFEELRLRQLRTVQSSGDIAPFTTDGCSGYQSQNWELLADILPSFEQRFGDRPPWESCCIAHDKTYWRGVALNGFVQRKTADLELKQCVVTTGQKMAAQLSLEFSASEDQIRKVFSVTAELMYRAVRLGGQPCSLLPWRWGYGWNRCAFAKISQIPEQYSNINFDEHITFFNTTAWLDTDSRNWHIPIHAWIYEPQDSVIRNGTFAELLEFQYGLKFTAATEENFRRRANLLIADSERDKNIVIRIGGQDVALPATEENGQVISVLKLPAELVNAFSDQGRLHYFAVTQPGDKRRFEGDVQLIARQGISVISDIDDTIKISNVRDHTQLFDNTFFQDFREVPGMPELYRQLANHGIQMHYVSSSPWQLYTPLQAFARNAGFPWATISLKKVRFRDETLFNLFKKGTETKPKQIETILQRYPGHRFILIGDSGEQDPEVYGEIARHYPSQIQHILIRNVDSSNTEDGRYQTAFEGISSSIWRLFEQPDEIAVKDLLSTQ